MNLVSDSVSDFGGVPVLRTYACRVARQLLLRAKLQNVAESQVLSTEDDLVEMAKARLQEFLLASFPDDRGTIRLAAIVAVKKVAASKIICDHDIDTDVKQGILKELSELPMDDLIPQVH